MATFITFASQKGGSGKTSLTIWAAGYLAYEKKFRVAAFDVDYAQYSLSKKRESDRKYVQENEALLEKFNKQGVGEFPIFKCTTENVFQLMEKYNDEFDYIFLDFKASITEPNVLGILSAIDYIFVPFEVEPLVFQSSAEFVLTLNQIKQNKASRIKKVVGYWFKYRYYIREDFFKQYEQIFASLPLDASIKSKIGDTGKTTYFDCRNTMFPPISRPATLNIRNFIIDFANIIKQ